MGIKMTTAVGLAAVLSLVGGVTLGITGALALVLVDRIMGH
jgi:hypothetical protein